MTLAAMSWQERAACKGMDPTVFHPTEGTAARQVPAVCVSCPVRPECLAAALCEDVRGDLGVWGGFSKAERVRLRNLLRSHARWSWLPAEPVKHPVTPGGYLRRSTRWHRRRALAEELAEHGGRLPRGAARRLAEGFGVSESSVSLDVKWLLARKEVRQ